MGPNGSSSSSASPCASCKLLRRRCTKECIFAPYFNSDEPLKFALVHKVFGASNVSKILQELPVHQRADAVSSLVYEANARVRDPVYGCVGAISHLQNQVNELQLQLAVAQAEIFSIQMMHHQVELSSVGQPMTNIDDLDHDKSAAMFLLSNMQSNLNNTMSSQYCNQDPRNRASFDLRRKM